MRRNRSTSHRFGSGLISSIAGAAGNILNRAIDILPAEVHLPFYQYCGPGTDLQRRLSRGDPGINKLDAACKLHDIAYSKFKDSKNRSVADRELAEKAWERVKTTDSSLGEKAAAWAVTNIMKAKTALGGGRTKNKTCKCKRKKKNSAKKKRNIKKQRVNNKKGKGLYLRPYAGSGNNNKKKKSNIPQKY